MSLRTRLEALASAVGADIKSIRAGYIPTWDTIAESMPSYVTVAHRCGTNVWGEETAEGFEDVVQSGYLPELDLQQLADGTLVACHDATVDRTMLNIGTGNVSTKTQAQWKAAQIKPAIVGGRTRETCFWNDILDQYGRRAILVPELKAGATSAITAFMAGVKKRGLQRSVIAQCFDYSVCLQFAANGIPALFLSSGVPVAGSNGVPAGWSWAGIKAAGIDYVCMDLNGNATATDVSNAKAAGLRVWSYTVNNTADQAASDAKGYTGTFSNDPWLTTGSIRTASYMPDDGNRPVGMKQFGSLPTSTGMGSEALYGDELAAPGGTVVSYQYMPALGRIVFANLPIRVSFRAHFSPTSNALSTNVGFVLSNVPAVGTFEDQAKTNQQAFACVVRRSGQLNSWKYQNGSIATAVNASPATVVAGINEVAPLTDEGWVDVSVIIDATNVQMWAQSPRYTSTTGSAVTNPTANGTFKTPAVAHGMSAAQLAGPFEFSLRMNGGASVSNFRVQTAI